MALIGPGPQIVLPFPAANKYNRYVVPENTVIVLNKNTPGTLYAQAYAYNGSSFVPSGGSISVYYWANVPQAYVGGSAGDYIVYTDGISEYSLAFVSAYQNPENLITAVSTDYDLAHWTPPSDAVLASPFPSSQIIMGAYTVTVLNPSPSSGSFPFGTPLVLANSNQSYVVNGNTISVSQYTDTLIPPAGTLTIETPGSNPTNYSTFTYTIT